MMEKSRLEARSQPVTLPPELRAAGSAQVDSALPLALALCFGAMLSAGRESVDEHYSVGA